METFAKSFSRANLLVCCHRIQLATCFQAMFVVLCKSSATHVTMLASAGEPGEHRGPARWFLQEGPNTIYYPHHQSVSKKICRDYQESPSDIESACLHNSLSQGLLVCELSVFTMCGEFTILRLHTSCDRLIQFMMVFSACQLAMPGGCMFDEFIFICIGRTGSLPRSCIAQSPAAMHHVR